MKVLHVINHLSSGGAERLVSDLTQRMNSDRFEVEILTLSDKGDVYSAELKSRGFAVFTLSNVSIYNFVIILTELCFFFWKHRYDLVHVHLFPCMYYVSFLKRMHLIKCPIIFHEHNTVNGRSRLSLLKPLDLYVYKPYSRIICISQAVNNMLVEKYGLKKNRLITIQNGVDILRCGKAVPVKRNAIDERIVENDILLIMVARFNKQKDHITVLKALSLLPNQYKLLLLGEGELEDDIKEKIKELKLVDRAFLCGYQSNVYEFIKTADIFILSSFFEGFGLSCIESMACGVPVIVSNVPGITDVVGDAAEKFEVGDVNGLVESIKMLSSDGAYYKHMTELGLKQAEGLSMDNMIKEMTRLYNFYDK